MRERPNTIRKKKSKSGSSSSELSTQFVSDVQRMRGEARPGDCSRYARGLLGKMFYEADDYCITSRGPFLPSSKPSRMQRSL